MSALEKSYTVVEAYVEIAETTVWGTSKADALRKIEEVRGTEDAYHWFYKQGDPLGKPRATLDRDREGNPVTRVVDR